MTEHYHASVVDRNGTRENYCGDSFDQMTAVLADYLVVREVRITRLQSARNTAGRCRGVTVLSSEETD